VVFSEIDDDDRATPVVQQTPSKTRQQHEINMADLNRQLRELVATACSHPPGNAVRQKALTEIIRSVEPKLWQEPKSSLEPIEDYKDALQQTWLYCCRNICEATTGEKYDPDRASLITWLNNYLKFRLKDIRIKETEVIVISVPLIKKGPDGETIDVIAQLPAPPAIPPMLEDVKKWVETDADGTLISIHIKGHPNANCQLLILRRLPPDSSWEQLSQELGIAIPTLSAFYQRKCMPKLHNFAKSEGYM
jgi:hypothetical protein